MEMYIKHDSSLKHNRNACVFYSVLEDSNVSQLKGSCISTLYLNPAILIAVIYPEAIIICKLSLVKYHRY